MSNSIQPVIKITRLEQVCMVVHDLDKSLEKMWNTFGIGPWNIILADANFLSDMTYYGKPAQFSFKVARTQSKIGDGMEMEFIEPLEGDSTFRDFLRDHGEGVHHIAWHFVDSLEAWHDTSRALGKAGFPCVTSFRTKVGLGGFFDTTKALGTVLEVAWRDPEGGKSLPLYVYPK